MHDISNSLTPTNISNLFASQSNIHSYNTRSSSRGDYYVKHSRLYKQTKSFSRYGVKIWNSLKMKCVKCPKITLKSMSTTLYSEYFQKKMMVLIYPTNNKNFLKTRLLRFAMYVIVNLTELNLFLFIYFTYFTLFL